MPDPSPFPAELLEQAARALTRAYAPYSGFRVGAAVRAADGSIHAGCNVENASYGLTNCAERTAVFSAVRDGHTRFDAVAVVTTGEALPFPCGACRQVLSEFCAPDTPVAIAHADRLDETTVVTLGELLPHAFRFPSG